MMKKFTIYNLQFTILTAVVALALLLGLIIKLNPATTLAQTADTHRATGLVTAPTTAPTSIFTTTSGATIFDSKAAFAPYKIPTYDDLKSLYYDQQKDASKKVDITATPWVTSSNYTNLSLGGKVYYKNGPLSIGSGIYFDSSGNVNLNYSGVVYSGVGVVFVNGDLFITGDLFGSGDTSGLVFIVKNNIVIDPEVYRINAVLIAGDKIYTAGSGCSLAGNIGINTPLNISGSLISINQIDQIPIKFCRKLLDNTLPAEKINHQVKYLVILRDLLSDTYQKWSEIQ